MKGDDEQVILRFSTDVIQADEDKGVSNSKVIPIGGGGVPEIGSNTGQINFYFPDDGFMRIAVKELWAQNEIIVDQIYPWADYVFEKNYNLITIDSLQKFIAKNKHLPNVPTQKHVKENGQTIAKTQIILLEKIEELTLYMIQQQKEIDSLKKEVINFKSKQ